jgi:hypothetical protein
MMLNFGVPRGRSWRIVHTHAWALLAHLRRVFSFVVSLHFVHTPCGYSRAIGQRVCRAWFCDETESMDSTR